MIKDRTYYEMLVQVTSPELLTLFDSLEEGFDYFQYDGHSEELGSLDNDSDDSAKVIMDGAFEVYETHVNEVFRHHGVVLEDTLTLQTKSNLFAALVIVVDEYEPDVYVGVSGDEDDEFKLEVILSLALAKEESFFIGTIKRAEPELIKLLEKHEDAGQVVSLITNRGRDRFNSLDKETIPERAKYVLRTLPNFGYSAWATLPLIDFEDAKPAIIALSIHAVVLGSSLQTDELETESYSLSALVATDSANEVRINGTLAKLNWETHE